MASIMISDLNPNNSEVLFNAELSPQETTTIVGGLIPDLDKVKDVIGTVTEEFVVCDSILDSPFYKWVSKNVFRLPYFFQGE